MSIGSFIGILIFNGTVIFGLYLWQMRLMGRKLKTIRQELQKLEDLVVAIIEEFSEVVTENVASPLLTPTQSSTESSFVNHSPVAPPLEDPPGLELAAVPEVTPQICQAFPAIEIEDSKHQKVLNLRDQGLEVAEIAKQLAIGQGEVKLILGLYQNIKT
jgi:hypothetical protein